MPNYILNHSKTGWRFPTDEILIGRMDRTLDKRSFKDYIRETLDDKELMDILVDMTDVEERYLNNKPVLRQKKVDKAGTGLRSQKDMF